jgi:hypothetical protein
MRRKTLPLLSALYRLSQAKNLKEVVKIQREFMSKQLNSFNEQTKAMVELCTKAHKMR